MKTKSTIAAALAVAMGMSCMLAACKPEGTQEGLTDKALSGSMLADYSKGDPGEKVQFASDGWTNGDPFNARWTKSQVSYSDGQMHLSISENPAENKPVGEGYLGGELRTSYYYGYGDYEVRMRPSASTGTASTFFVCTGNYDVWPDGTKNPWDEIDIEFLGKDTTEVQFNYFANGTGGHEFMYKLGFDASKEFHNYGFRWAEDYITWFVDGKPVYRVDKANVKEGETFPKTAGRILMNYWSGTENGVGWMGKFAGPDGKTADYEWVKTSAKKENPPMGDPYPDKPDKPDTPDTPPAGETLDWSKVEAQELGFESTEKYTVAPAADKKSAGITYTGVTTDYANIEMNITDSAAEKNAVHLKLKNNGTATVNVRVNLVNDEKLNAGAQNAAVNKSATQDGKTVRTDLEWGGSFFDIEAGKEAECVVVYEGVANKLQLMIDSAIYGNTEAKSGDLTVSELKFAKSGEEGGETPELPEANNNGVTVNGAKLTFAGNTGAGEYVIVTDAAANTMRVAYADLAGGSYKNIWADVKAVARTKNVFTVKVTNNGTGKLVFRVDVESETQKEHTTCCNVSATQDGSEMFTDTTWGGSKFEIDAGKTAVCKVTYNTAEGPTNVKLFFDSSVDQDKNTYNGDVLLSEMAFEGEGSYTPAEPQQPEVPAGEPVALTFNAEANSGYTVTAGAENKSWTFGYVGKGNTYKPVTADCATLAAGKNTFSVKIKNDKDTAVTVRVDVQGTTRVDTSNGDGSGSGTDCTNKSATCTGGTGLYTDTTWGGTKVTLAAGEEVTLVITYDATMAQGAVKNILIFVDSMGGDENDHDASVTVSGFLFGSKQN